MPPSGSRPSSNRTRSTCARYFFHLPPPPQLYPLSLHDALPIYSGAAGASSMARRAKSTARRTFPEDLSVADRKSTRLNSSHLGISYAVFCLKKKKRPPRPRDRDGLGAARPRRGGRRADHQGERI